MKTRWFQWTDAGETAPELRAWFSESAQEVDVDSIERSVLARGDGAVLEMTGRFDATGTLPKSLQVDPAEAKSALAEIHPDLRAALDAAATNIDAVARAQISDDIGAVDLPGDQTVELRDVPVASAGIYAPGGRAVYPSSVLMGCIPAQVAGVERIALATPPRPDGRIDPVTLAAASLCGIVEIYAMGGAQAIFALAHGTETVTAVDVIAGPGNSWVTEAKRSVYGKVGIDSLAGPSELMVIATEGANLDWLALDLCAQAEHGPDSPLIAAGPDRDALEALAKGAQALAADRPSVHDAPLALIVTPTIEEAAALSQAFAPEHLQLAGPLAEILAPVITNAGCVFIGPGGATAFGDYAAGSNHVLPSGGAGRFSGPLGPGVFRRRIANVTVSPEAAADLAPHVDLLARAEGLPVHGESAMARIPKPGGESDVR